jgi:hypothetical protein
VVIYLIYIDLMFFLFEKFGEKLVFHPSSLPY